jgi:hypothetical protein
VRVMRTRVGVVVLGGGGKYAIVATVNNATIGVIGSIPPPLPSMTTAIATVDECHCCCYTVNDDDHQMPVVTVCH